ncbi:type III-B CRISPR module RAMP protein Cmr4 [Synechococcus sp. PCC 7502]|uniref:type III-B CRISPR module RAMP protein Cmr4 n=1 Tax=Synechococcus sp. PCC 7502 TaxID=1173263 RepID=UPI00059C642D|nr:type III-B CRISPR module RAMP protein Cmr4 [Synechococcus sp. PCC 7502]
MELTYLYLIAPLHTGGTTQEGNLLGIARESHTNLPYIPSSTIRGRLRSSESDQQKKFALFGNEIADGVQLEQGSIWIGDGSILWLPVPSLSHGVVWVSSPLLLRRWLRFAGNPDKLEVPDPYSTSLSTNAPVYLKDAILPAADLRKWTDWDKFTTNHPESEGMKNVLVLPDQHCATLIQMSLWRQVKIKLDQDKTVDGGFRYEEAIPPDTLMYFPWGVTSQANGSSQKALTDFKTLLKKDSILQIGGQESLGRGFVQLFI